MRSASVAVVGLVTALVLTGCSRVEDDQQRTADTSGAAVSATSDDGPAGVLEQVPEQATHLVMVDFAAVRERMGVPELSSQSLMTDRIEFWQQAPTATVLLTEGALREQTSRLDLRYGFTQDDVQREYRWAGSADDVPGFRLDFRPDLDPEGLAGVIEDEVPPLAAAHLDIGDGDGPIVFSEPGPAPSSWAQDPVLVELTGAALAETGLESALIRRGCVPILDALGVNATTDDLDALQAVHGVEDLVQVGSSAVVVTGLAGELSATVRISYPVGTDPAQVIADLRARVDLAAAWPRADLVWVGDGFDLDSASAPEVVSSADAVIGELRLPVLDPATATAVLLSDLLPLGVCGDLSGLTDLAEPTGL